MKVLHLVAGQLDGGAARGAYWLHSALRELDVESTILTNARDNLGDNSVISLTSSTYGKLKFAILRRLGLLPIKAYRNRQPLTFNTGLDGIDITRHPAYKAADLVHLHWVNGLVNVRSLKKVKKPLVWTLRDMWPITRGCHQSMDCERFTDSCVCFPQLGREKYIDQTRYDLKHKQASLPDHIRAVGMSRWMSQRASQSALFGDHDISTISNNVDTELFSPLEKSVARQALEIPGDEKIVLVGALDVTSIYKGFDLFLDALEELDDMNVRIVFFGNSSTAIPESLRVPVTSLGYLSDAISLRLAYSAADVFVAPSRADAFGKTLVEAMSCGTPVVCFDATGPRDIVEHHHSGYLAEPFRTSDLAEGIRWVLEQPADAHAELCDNARVRAQQHFDSRVIAREYLALYEELCGAGQTEAPVMPAVARDT